MSSLLRQREAMPQSGGTLSRSGPRETRDYHAEDLPGAAHAGRSGCSPDRPRRPSLALDPGQAVLDPGFRPGTPRYGEELEPLLDEEVRVHRGRDEIHPGSDAVLQGGRRDFIERSLIDVALVVEWHPQLDRKI